VTFLPGFVPHAYSVGAVSVLFGAIFIAETALYFTVLLAVSTAVTRWLGTARIRRRMDAATGSRERRVRSEPESRVRAGGPIRLRAGRRFED